MRTLHAVTLLGLLALPIAGQSPQDRPGQSSSQAGEYKLDPITTQNASYPAAALQKKVEGDVAATFLVLQTGEVANVHAWTHEATLGQAVEDAVRGWKFRPVTRGGNPIQVVAKATFKFVLSDETQVSKGVVGDIGAATDITSKMRVSNRVMSGILVHKVNPMYPEDARHNGIQGTVLLAATINREGSVTDLRLISGPPELVPAAMEAVKQWRYKPYLFMGITMEVETEIQINFSLHP